MFITTYSKNLTSSYLPLISRFIGSIIFIPFAFNTLGDSEYGTYILWGTAVSYLMFFNLGAPQALTQWLSSKNHSLNSKSNRRILSSLIGITTLIFTALLLALFILYLIPLTFNTPLTTRNLIRVILILSIFYFKMISDLLDSSLRSINKLYINQIINSTSYFIYIGAAFILLYNHSTLESIFLAQLISTITSAALFYVYVRKFLHYRVKFSDMSHFASCKKILKPGWWYFLSSLTSIVIFQTDSITISLFFPASTIAIYGLMFKFADIIRTAINNIVNVLFVNIARLKYKKDSSYLVWSHFIRSMCVTVTISILICTVLYVYGYQLLVFWLKKDLGSESMFNYFILYIFLFTTNQVPSLYLGALSEHKEIVKLGTLQAGLNLLLSVITIYIYKDVSFVIISTCVSLIITNYWYNPYMLYKKTRI